MTEDNLPKELPELPLLTYDEISSIEQECSEKQYVAFELIKTGAEAERDLCLETLKKAGYEAKKMTKEKLPRELPVMEPGSQLNADQLLYDALWEENEKLKAELARVRQETMKETALEIGLLLLNAIAYQMLANKEAGLLLADQLKDVIRICQKKAGISGEVLDG